MLIGALLIIVPVCAIAYSIRAFLQFDDDDLARCGAVLLGLGGIVMIASSTLLGGMMMAAGCALIVGIVPNATTIERSSQPRPVLGLLALLASLPLLTIGSALVWDGLSTLLPGPSEQVSPYVFVFAALAAVGGGLLFRYGYAQTAMPDRGLCARLAVLGAAAVALGWFPLVRGGFWVQRQVSGPGTPAAETARTPSGLVSRDGSIALEMPEGWTSLSREGTVLFMYKDDAVISISQAGTTRPLSEMLASLEKSRAEISSRGAALEGEIASRALAKGGSMVSYRFRQEGTPCSQIEFTAAGRSYSASARGLDAEAEKALYDSLSKL